MGRDALSGVDVNVQALISKLEREQYETDDPKHTVTDLAFRRGWNARGREMAAALRVESGLVELVRAEPIDLRFKAALTGFDVSDEEKP